MTFQAAKAVSVIFFTFYLPFVLVTEQPRQRVGRVEFRLAETRYAEGLIEAVVAGTGDKVYLHKETVVTDHDIFQARLAQGNTTSDFGIVIAFTEEGAKKMANATKGHLNKPLALLLEGKVVVAQQANMVIEEYCRFTGFSKSEAQRIAKAISLSSVLSLIDRPGHVKLEIRLAQGGPGKGLMEAVEKNTQQKIYIFKEVLISNHDILEARVVKGYMDGVFDIELALTGEAPERIARACESSKGKMLAVLINGRVVSAPYIVGKVSTNQISGDFTKEEAESIVNALNVK